MLFTAHLVTSLFTTRCQQCLPNHASQRHHNVYAPGNTTSEERSNPSTVNSSCSVRHPFILCLQHHIWICLLPNGKTVPGFPCVTWGGSNKTIPHKVIELLPIEQVRVLEQTCKESIKKKTQVETQAKTGSLTGGSEEAGKGKRRTVTCTRRGSQLQVAEKRLWS